MRYSVNRRTVQEVNVNIHTCALSYYGEEEQNQKQKKGKLTAALKR